MAGQNRSRSADFKDAVGQLIAHIAASIPSLVQELLPNGRRQGDWWRTGNIRDEKPTNGVGSFSVSLETGSYKEFNGEHGGDLVDLYAKVNAMSQKDALIDLGKRFGFSHPLVDGQRAPQKRPGDPRTVHVEKARTEEQKHKAAGHLLHDGRYWVPRSADPKALPKLRAGVRRWLYLTEKGRVAFAVHRYDHPEKGKMMWVETPVIPADGSSKNIIYIKKGTNPKKRPIYNIPKISQNPKATIVWVEGEKTAEAVQKATAGTHVASTWHGGTGALKDTPLHRLAGRKVILWPDADKAGREAMKRVIREQFAEHDVQVVGVVNTAMFKEKFDAADFDDPKDIRFHLQPENLISADAFLEAPSEFVDAGEMTEEDRPATEQARLAIHKEPIFLGTDGEQIFYMLPSNMQISHVSNGGITKSVCKYMADDSFWATFCLNDNNKIDWDLAVGWANEQARRAGSFTPSKRRQRGCWPIDRDSYVIHWGDKVQKVVNGEPQKLLGLYEAFRKGGMGGIYIQDDGDDDDNTRHGEKPLYKHEPATDEEMQKYCDHIMALNWHGSTRGEDGKWQGDAGRVYFGWMYLAAACGAYDFRPSIWVTGESGTGKSTILSNGSSMILGKSGWGITIDGGTTSPAAAKQKVDSRAIPIILDEMEPKKHHDKLEEWMSMMRASSYAGSPVRISGSPSGKTRTYNTQSCMQFTSITSGVDREADASRLLFLRTGDKRTGADSSLEFDELVYEFERMERHDFPKRFLVRAMLDVHRVQRCAKMIREHLVAMHMPRRRADLISILEAAYYCGQHSTEMTSAIASVLAKNGLAKVYEEQKTDTESANLLSSLSYMTIEYDMDGKALRTIARRALSDYYAARLRAPTDPYQQEVADRLFRALRDSGLEPREVSPDIHRAMPKPDSMARYVDIWPGNPSMKRKLNGLAHGLKNTLDRFGGVPASDSNMGRGVIRVPVDSLGIYDKENS